MGVCNVDGGARGCTLLRFECSGFIRVQFSVIYLHSRSFLPQVCYLYTAMRAYFFYTNFLILRDRRQMSTASFEVSLTQHLIKKVFKMVSPIQYSNKIALTVTFTYFILCFQLVKLIHMSFCQKEVYFIILFFKVLITFSSYSSIIF